MNKLFAYGTLIDPQQVERVVGRPLPMRTATLHGYERVRHPRSFYASVQPNAQGRVDGQLIEGVDEAAWKALDAYEGPLYERKLLTVDVWGGDNVEAFVYVHTERDAPLITAREEDYRDDHPTEQFAWKALKATCIALLVLFIIGGIVASIDFMRFGGQGTFYDMARVVQRDNKGFVLRINRLSENYQARMSLRSYRRRYGRLYPYPGQLAKVKYQVARNGRDVKLLDVELIWPGGAENGG